jgi:hypothetical protein
MIRKVLLVSLLIILLGACTPQTDLPPAYPSAYDDPTNNETPVSPEPGAYLPQPADSALTKGEALVATNQLLTLESYPLQFNLNLTGSLPTPCHQLRVEVSQPDAKNQVMVDVYSVVDPDAVCAQVVQPFEVTVPLGSYPSGHYTLLINGLKATEFDS